MSEIHKASCDCGAVSFETPLNDLTVGACHCSSCQKISSSFYMAAHYSGEIKFNGAENITIYDSSDWAHRAFCSKCGSNLYYKLKSADEYSLSAALFDDKSEFELKTQLFTDIKPAYIELTADTQNMTRQECFDKWG
ncbi:MAG: GFA family protein [OCS116 cluster bacterium]|nr:GFA family protein [OCS116 cluster bacterium]